VIATPPRSEPSGPLHPAMRARMPSARRSLGRDSQTARAERIQKAPLTQHGDCQGEPLYCACAVFDKDRFCALVPGALVVPRKVSCSILFAPCACRSTTTAAPGPSRFADLAAMATSIFESTRAKLGSACRHKLS
jgi:hypothetical protein